MLSISRRNLITLGAGFFMAGALSGCGDDQKAASNGNAGSKGTGYKIGVLQLTEHGALDLTNKGFVAAALSGCGDDQKAASNGNAGSKGTGYKIGVLQLTEHGALDLTNKGFVAALEDSGISYTIDQQNAQNDQSACQTIASKLVNDGDDLIFAIATPAAQAAAGVTSDIPVVGSAITDYAVSGLVASNEEPGGNVTGTSDLTPVADQIGLLRQLLPEAKRVGILFCSAESNSGVQVALAEEVLDDAGIEHERYAVSSSNEIQQMVESMAGKVDAIYAPTSGRGLRHHRLRRERSGRLQ